MTVPARFPVWVYAAVYSLALAAFFFWRLEFLSGPAAGAALTFGVFSSIASVVYFASSRDPLRHWSALIAGLLTHVYFAGAVWLPVTAHLLPKPAAIVVHCGSAVILYFTVHALQAALEWEHKLEDRIRTSSISLPAELLESMLTADGRSLAGLLRDETILLTFLRHSGCSFCPESLSELGRNRRRIEAQGAGIVIVHASRPERILTFMMRYGLQDIPTVRDQDHRLYRAFGLRRGTLFRLFGPQNWLRAISALRKGFLPGPADGDPYMLTGVFLVRERKALRGFYQRNVSDRLDYLGVSREALNL